MMRQLTIRMRALEVDAATAYRRISDFASYPRCTDAVAEVTVREADPGSAVSDWAVSDWAVSDWAVSDWTLRFGTGLLRWTERDSFDPQRRTITFTQVTGDFVAFDGSWTIDESAGHPVVGFDALIDLGIPAFAELLDPVVESTLRDIIKLIFADVLGQVEEIEETVLSNS